MLALHPRRLRLVAALLLRYDSPREQSSMGNLPLPSRFILFRLWSLRLAPHELQSHTLDD